MAAGWRVLVIVGPADEAAAAALLAALPPDRAQQAGGLTLPQLVALLPRVSLYVGNDSGVSHLSSSLDVPTLALFGPTDPAIWGPRGPRVQVVWAGAATSVGVMLSPMTALPVDAVFNAAQGVVRSGS